MGDGTHAAQDPRILTGKPQLVQVPLELALTLERWDGIHRTLQDLVGVLKEIRVELREMWRGGEELEHGPGGTV